MNTNKMNTKINCPVCGYQGIETDICPNCQTDVFLIRSLQGLEPDIKDKLWSTGIAILMLIIGITIGVGASFFALQNLYSFNTDHTNNSSKTRNSTNPTNPTVTTSPILSVPIKPVVPTTPPSITYSVKSGDTLSGIAGKLCSKPTDWLLIVAVNPELQKRENQLKIDQVLKIPPTCKGKKP
ncbi:LysM peptidoglycan-binding domain-containing protein [Anabaena sp. FACHB-1237]|uniref:LysM peptidoglycan-binding domain-containing protein n=1 Tax=Anabaena sp. FACHB-1237 TaxID=2692769 RepID=UPI001F559322|nr:LysM peptidoglycan-binding domain-containing protein [Anabaena sp. FACHB-1237]